jgi:uncharacterized protein
MGIELRPLGVACNLACHYCYQNPQRDAGNQRMTYNLDKMKAETLRIGGPFTLFGGEPLLMPFDDLENLLSWGLDKLGGSSLQTNGILITSRHIDLFRRCKVSVGISIDGPGELNDARWHRELDKTRQSTAAVENIIERLCREYEPPGLIVTLHKGNAVADKLPIMTDWVRRLHSLGVRTIRLHLLEVDHASVRQGLALSARENIQALLAFAEVQSQLPGMHFDLFDEMEALLEGKDGKVGCTWRACDPYTTEAVQGIEGNGQSSNCGRTNKEGIGFIKSAVAGYERYLALYKTPQAANGCQGCRFFLMCKGQCPGTAIDGDWRNRTEHCEEWKQLFRMLERRMIAAGKVPLTIQPLRFDLEARQMQAWQRGDNPSLNRLLADWHNGQPAAPAPAHPQSRLSWVSERAREKWETRLQTLPAMLEDITVLAAAAHNRCAIRLVPSASFPRLTQLAAAHGLSSARLPAEALPQAISTRPADPDCALFLAGPAAAVACAQSAWHAQDLASFHALLDIPACCLRPSPEPVPPSAEIPAAQQTHTLLDALGLSVLPIHPCRANCPSAQQASADFLNLAQQHGYAAQADWLRECLSWPVSYSELHGVAELKTPLFRLCFQAACASAPARLIRRIGSAAHIEDAAVGLTFPFAPPARPPRLVEIQ